ncbi:MAG: response regulator [Firmicutes bacterium]|nr:response regulator [Bacillota bacterium]
MKDKILIVDDDYNILAAYKRSTHGIFDVTTARDGAEGIKLIRDQGPFSVVVSDFRMPEMNGIQFLSQVREIAPDTTRIMLTGQADLNVAIDAVNEGSIFRFLTKPCATDKFIGAINAAIKQYRLVIAERELLEKTLKGSVKLLIDMLAFINPSLYGRASRISSLAKNLAVSLNLEKPWEIELIALLSQIGCLTIPQEIINKKFKGKTLSYEESKMYLSHPEMGKRLIKNIPRLEEIADAIEYQLKNFDGSGMSKDNLKGKDIPYPSRILRVAIGFLELEERGVQSSHVIEFMRSDKGWYDPEILTALEVEILSSQRGYRITAIDWRLIETGMILADDLKDKNGTIILPKGSEITDAQRASLLNYARFGTITEPIKIMAK